MSSDGYDRMVERIAENPALKEVGMVVAVPSEMVAAVDNVAELGPWNAKDGVVWTSTNGTAFVLDGPDIGVEIPPCPSVEAGELLPAAHGETPPWKKQTY